MITVASNWRQSIRVTRVSQGNARFENSLFICSQQQQTLKAKVLDGAEKEVDCVLGQLIILPKLMIGSAMGVFNVEPDRARTG
jgi:hypothetical protein